MRSGLSRLALSLACVTLVLSAGCVERTMQISTAPPGALITVNDEEVGVSPVKFSFTWYGDYEIVARKPGYETFKTHHQINAPWYQYPPIDIVAELLWPAMIQDERQVPELALVPAQAPEVSEVVERAETMRARARVTPVE